MYEIQAIEKSPWPIFIAFASGYFMSFALRSINAVLSPELIREFNISNAQLGALSSAYFFGFAIMQLPLGVLLDRIGPRRTNAGLLWVAALGCGLFSFANDFYALWLGRALIGAGVAGGLMSALSAYRFSFPAALQQRLAAWMLMVGSFGALSTTVPVRWSVPVMGWRPLFWIAALFLVLASLTILKWAPERHRKSKLGHEGGDAHPVSALTKVDKNVAATPSEPSLAAPNDFLIYYRLLSNGFMWRYGLLCMVIHASFIAFQSLWAGPWLVQVSELSLNESATVLLLFNFVLMLGFLGMGAIAPRIKREQQLVIVVATCIAVIAIQALLAYLPSESSLIARGLHWPYLGAALWLLMALAGVPFTLVQPFVCLSFPAAVTGRAYTTYNLLVFSGVFFVQWFFGVIADYYKVQGHAGGSAIKSAMGAWVVIELVALTIFLVWPFQRTYQGFNTRKGAH